MLKIVCLGGGSLYFTRVLPDLLMTDDLNGAEIVLYDIDEEKNAGMAEMGTRLVVERESNCAIRATGSLEDAVDGADFFISSLGGSGASVASNVHGSYYHRSDITIPLKYGVYQVVGDTCGPAGMMMAFRSIPVYLQVCREIERRCPKAVLFNHSNPMAVLCRAMKKYTDVNVIGICHGVQNGIGHASRVLEIPPQELECTWIGTNHYYWFMRIVHKGKDMFPELMRRLDEYPDLEGKRLSARLSRIYRYPIVYPQDDHIWEFYPFATHVRDVKSLPYELLKSARDHGFDPDEHATGVPGGSRSTDDSIILEYQSALDQVRLPEKQDNTVTAEGISAIIRAIALSKRELAIVNIPNRGLITNLPGEGIVEVEGVTDSMGVRGIQIGEAPLYLKGLLEKRFAWQEITADAAVKGDRNLALQALLLDEMAILPENAEAMLNEMMTASQDLLPQFQLGG